MSSSSLDLLRPYLVIPKLIEQPTWGGQYIVSSKGWSSHEDLVSLKIGQSYELFSGSNLSLLDSSDDPRFVGELTNRDAVAVATTPELSVPLDHLVSASPEKVLGKSVVANRGPSIKLLIKYTQALGNSFQVHIKDGATDPVWKPKPESWYYFEPGLITLGVKAGIDWQAYEDAATAIEEDFQKLSQLVKTGKLTFENAKSRAHQIVKKYDPWRFVNTVSVDKDQLVDLSSGGLHHSWEEDPTRAPLGNVLYELQAEALDKISTFRSFDKGKMEADGSVRELEIQEYFKVIDRSPEANDPTSHLRQAQSVERTQSYTLDRLLETKYYNLDRLTLLNASATYDEPISSYKHLFVKSGRVDVTAAGKTITIAQAHACFIPASAEDYSVTSQSDLSEVLISY
jgi:mannose-6-phosphate isomerase class I